MAEPSLADLRREIDRLDAAMHDLLIERGTIIDRLIAVKKTQDSGSAFRPGREAAMMKVLAERHHGLLPFDTIESIWRIIISTFTYVQAPYAVHASVEAGDDKMRDSARFHFGFTVPYVTHKDVISVIKAVQNAAGDLGIFSFSKKAASPWWLGLDAPAAPKIIARLPFVERPDHPAGTPVFVISKPLADAAVRETVIFHCETEEWNDVVGQALSQQGLLIETEFHHDDTRRSFLLSGPGSHSVNSVSDLFTSHHIKLSSIGEIGSHAARFQLLSQNKAG
ncbi:MAG: chorismate mutase [Hyphomicrobiales bacterium]|jgi:chorismate mutase|nr:chorismate mutase [Hyphomicrobiales bacterium]